MASMIYLPLDSRIGHHHLSSCKALDRPPKGWLNPLGASYGHLLETPFHNFLQIETTIEKNRGTIRLI